MTAFFYKQQILTGRRLAVWGEWSLDEKKRKLIISCITTYVRRVVPVCPSARACAKLYCLYHCMYLLARKSRYNVGWSMRICGGLCVIYCDDHTLSIIVAIRVLSSPQCAVWSVYCSWFHPYRTPAASVLIIIRRALCARPSHCQEAFWQSLTKQLPLVNYLQSAQVKGPCISNFE